MKYKIIHILLVLVLFSCNNINTEDLEKERIEQLKITTTIKNINRKLYVPVSLNNISVIKTNIWVVKDANGNLCIDSTKGDYKAGEKIDDRIIQRLNSVKYDTIYHYNVIYDSSYTIFDSKYKLTLNKKYIKEEVL